jgi:uncharacterized protein with von Willebrand factor type A (vWA) domain
VIETVVLDLPPLVGALSRRLRDAGLPMTPARSADLARALELVRPISRRRLYWTARSIVVTDPTQVKAFDAVFAAVFGPREVVPPDRPHPPSTPDGAQPSLGEGRGERVVDVPVPLPSDDEVLAEKRFDSLEPHELAHLYRLMSRLRLETPQRRTRRYAHGRGRRLDMRRTLRASLRTAGEPMRLSRRRRRVQRRRLVLLCDISGSMEPYARAYLQFLTSATGSDRRAEAFVFATRLTRLTRALASRNPERAIQRAAETAPDWSSGTRIGDALKTFNDRHGRRGMARGAVVVIISDGWERGDPALVGRQMERLTRLAHRIVWVNPRVSARAFSVQAGGMVAALPHCDALVSGHSFNALSDVVAAIGGAEFEPPTTMSEDEETWASATPVAGSSVAMPSGYGPSRGRTTPGWK